MSTEFYGVDAQIVSSVGATPVSTDTNIIFIGACASGNLNQAYLITSMSDYATKLGGAAGDGYNLSEAAVAAFQIAGLRQVWMIPVSHDIVFDADDYLGDASLFTGIYAIESLLRDTPTAVNILCAPSITDSSVLAALDGVANLAAGHWQSFMMYDVVENTDQINDSGIAQAAEIVADKQLADSHALAVWGHVKTSGGYIVSGAAVRACLQAKSDADYDAPARSGGNLQIPAIQGICLLDVEELESDAMSGTQSTGSHSQPLKFSASTREYEANAEYFISELNVTSGEIIDPQIIDLNGEIALQFDTGTTGVFGYTIKIEQRTHVGVTLMESAATELSADGICSYNYYGNGVYYTWGDHPSIFAGGTVGDEANRFDNYIRMNMMIANRFQLTWRFSIDNPMNLSMRNDVITYELDQLNRLKSRGALIGEPLCEFKPEQNSTADLQLGKFVWSIACTETPPSKYMKVEVAYTPSGLSVLTQGE